MYLTLDYGRHLLPPKPSGDVAATITHSASVSSSGASSLLSALNENAKGPLSRLLLQLIVIIVATRTVSALFARFGQPPVIGEMAAGILLGPSLLGWLWPEAFSFLFPQESMGILELLSQIGVCLFMFVVGMELEVSYLRGNTHKAVLVSHTSIMFPFLLGSVAALYLYSKYAAPGAKKSNPCPLRSGIEYVWCGPTRPKASATAAAMEAHANAAYLSGACTIADGKRASSEHPEVVTGYS